MGRRRVRRQRAHRAWPDGLHRLQPVLDAPRHCDARLLHGEHRALWEHSRGLPVCAWVEPRRRDPTPGIPDVSAESCRRVAARPTPGPGGVSRRVLTSKSRNTLVATPCGFHPDRREAEPVPSRPHAQLSRVAGPVLSSDALSSLRPTLGSMDDATSLRERAPSDTSSRHRQGILVAHAGGQLGGASCRVSLLLIVIC
jgi:hypothetical protein